MKRETYCLPRLPLSLVIAFFLTSGSDRLEASSTDGRRGPEVKWGTEALVRRDRIKPFIIETARKTGLNPKLIEAVVFVESNFNATAVSSKGARGLMQLLPETGKRYGARDLFDPAENLLAGSKHLLYLLDLFDNDLNLALAAYNAGEQSVVKYRGIPPYPETRSFVKKVLSCYRSPPWPGGEYRSSAPRSPPPNRTFYKYIDDRGVIHLTTEKPEGKPRDLEIIRYDEGE